MTIAVIPSFNEEKNISSVVRKTKKYVNKVIVVDDGSKDKTGKFARRAGAIVLTHRINLGVGATNKTGCEAALKLKADIIITLDGDGQHNPKEIPKMIKKIKEGYDIVFGARIKKRKKMPLLRKLGNRLSSNLQNFLFKSKLSDVQSGYRCFTKSAYKKIRWETSGYNVENEIIINVVKNNLRYCEIPIDTVYNDAYKGISPVDGFKILLFIIKKRITLKKQLAQ